MSTRDSNTYLQDIMSQEEDDLKNTIRESFITLLKLLHSSQSAVRVSQRIIKQFRQTIDQEMSASIQYFTSFMNNTQFMIRPVLSVEDLEIRNEGSVQDEEELKKKIADLQSTLLLYQPRILSEKKDEFDKYCLDIQNEVILIFQNQKKRLQESKKILNEIFIEQAFLQGKKIDQRITKLKMKIQLKREQQKMFKEMIKREQNVRAKQFLILHLNSLKDQIQQSQKKITSLEENFEERMKTQMQKLWQQLLKIHEEQKLFIDKNEFDIYQHLRAIQKQSLTKLLQKNTQLDQIIDQLKKKALNHVEKKYFLQKLNSSKHLFLKFSNEQSQEIFSLRKKKETNISLFFKDQKEKKEELMKDNFCQLQKMRVVVTQQSLKKKKKQSSLEKKEKPTDRMVQTDFKKKEKKSSQRRSKSKLKREHSYEPKVNVKRNLELEFQNVKNKSKYLK